MSGLSATKIIEAKVDGKFVPMGEDVLKNKASIRMLPLLPVIEKLLLQQKEKQEFMLEIYWATLYRLDEKEMR